MTETGVCVRTTKQSIVGGLQTGFRHQAEAPGDWEGGGSFVRCIRPVREAGIQRNSEGKCDTGLKL